MEEDDPRTIERSPKVMNVVGGDVAGIYDFATYVSQVCNFAQPDRTVSDVAVVRVVEKSYRRARANVPSHCGRDFRVELS
jgi:hypothetical protein